MQKSVYCLSQNTAVESDQVIILILYCDMDGGHFKNKTKTPEKLLRAEHLQNYTDTGP